MASWCSPSQSDTSHQCCHFAEPEPKTHSLSHFNPCQGLKCHKLDVQVSCWQKHRNRAPNRCRHADDASSICLKGEQPWQFSFDTICLKAELPWLFTFDFTAYLTMCHLSSVGRTLHGAGPRDTQLVEF